MWDRGLIGEQGTGLDTGVGEGITKAQRLKDAKERDEERGWSAPEAAIERVHGLQNKEKEPIHRWRR